MKTLKSLRNYFDDYFYNLLNSFSISNVSHSLELGYVMKYMMKDYQKVIGWIFCHGKYTSINCRGFHEKNMELVKNSTHSKLENLSEI